MNKNKNFISAIASLAILSSTTLFFSGCNSGDAEIIPGTDFTNITDKNIIGNSFFYIQNQGSDSYVFNDLNTTNYDYNVIRADDINSTPVINDNGTWSISNSTLNRINSYSGIESNNKFYGNFSQDDFMLETYDINGNTTSDEFKLVSIINNNTPTTDLNASDIEFKKFIVSGPNGRTFIFQSTDDVIVDTNSTPNIVTGFAKLSDSASDNPLGLTSNEVSFSFEVTPKIYPTISITLENGNILEFNPFNKGTINSLSFIKNINTGEFLVGKSAQNPIYSPPPLYNVTTADLDNYDLFYENELTGDELKISGSNDNLISQNDMVITFSNNLDTNDKNVSVNDYVIQTTDFNRVIATDKNTSFNSTLEFYGDGNFSKGDKLIFKHTLDGVNFIEDKYKLIKRSSLPLTQLNASSLNNRIIKFTKYIDGVNKTFSFNLYNSYLLSKFIGNDKFTGNAKVTFDEGNIPEKDYLFTTDIVNEHYPKIRFYNKTESFDLYLENNGEINSLVTLITDDMNGNSKLIDDLADTPLSYISGTIYPSTTNDFLNYTLFLNDSNNNNLVLTNNNIKFDYDYSGTTNSNYTFDYIFNNYVFEGHAFQSTFYFYFTGSKYINELVKGTYTDYSTITKYYNYNYNLVGSLLDTEISALTPFVSTDFIYSGTNILGENSISFKNANNEILKIDFSGALTKITTKFNEIDYTSLTTNSIIDNSINPIIGNGFINALRVYKDINNLGHNVPTIEIEVSNVKNSGTIDRLYYIEFYSNDNNDKGKFLSAVKISRINIDVNGVPIFDPNTGFNEVLSFYNLNVNGFNNYIPTKL